MGEKKSSATIEAKPQIRNMQAEVTRFMPVSVRVKRNPKKSKGKKGKSEQEDTKPKVKVMPGPAPKPTVTAPKATKDDAYDAFMKEMEGYFG